MKVKRICDLLKKKEYLIIDKFISFNFDTSGLFNNHNDSSVSNEFLANDTSKYILLFEESLNSTFLNSYCNFLFFGVVFIYP